MSEFRYTTDMAPFKGVMTLDEYNNLDPATAKRGMYIVVNGNPISLTNDNGSGDNTGDTGNEGNTGITTDENGNIVANGVIYDKNDFEVVNNMIRLKTPVRSATQTEFDELSEEEQHRGMWIVDDDVNTESTSEVVSEENVDMDEE